MSKMTRFFGGAVFAVALLFGAGSLPAQASSLTQTQISTILAFLSSFGVDSATIANVSAALGGKGMGTEVGFCHNFYSDLTVGNNGYDVTGLNQALAAAGVFDSNSAYSQNFTENTAASVVKFQAKYGINQTGYVGPITRAKLNALYGCSIINPYPSAAAPIITSTDSTGMVTPGVTVTVKGQNFDSGSYIKLDYAQLITPYYTSATSLSFTLPSNVSVGSHTIQVLGKASNLASNSVMLNVVASNQVPTITVLSPNGGEVLRAGDQVTVKWKTSDNISKTASNIWIWAILQGSENYYYVDLVTKHIINDGVETVTIPSNVSTGTYKMVVDVNGVVLTSDIGAIEDRSDNYFTITSATSAVSNPVISGISGPTSLQTGQSGRWTVTASDPNAVSGMLGYSVVWGDENNVGMAASATATTQQTTSFTHTYSRAGNYNPTFTVINSSGGSAKTSISVVVK